jgi:hypothetical protein
VWLHVAVRYVPISKEAALTNQLIVSACVLARRLCQQCCRGVHSAAAADLCTAVSTAGNAQQQQQQHSSSHIPPAFALLYLARGMHADAQHKVNINSAVFPCKASIAQLLWQPMNMAATAAGGSNPGMLLVLDVFATVICAHQLRVFKK